MAACSQNGYPANDRSDIVTMTVPGTAVKLPVRKGVCGLLLLWAAERWHHEVEQLTPGWNWGYAERKIVGSSTTLSNHASGTAIDLNAPAHPLGTTASRTLSAAQIAAAHRIAADSRGALRWGGDYDQPSFGGVAGSRPDPMHWEINASESVCAQVLAEVSGRTDVSDVWARRETAWAGGYTDSANTPYDLMMFVKRNNVEVRQANIAIARLTYLVEQVTQELADLRYQLAKDSDANS